MPPTVTVTVTARTRITPPGRAGGSSRGIRVGPAAAAAASGPGCCQCRWAGLQCWDVRGTFSGSLAAGQGPELQFQPEPAACQWHGHRLTVTPPGRRACRGPTAAAAACGPVPRPRGAIVTQAQGQQ